jgi:hypothetical protein
LLECFLLLAGHRAGVYVIFMSFRGPQALIVILGKVSAKEEISTVVVAARACGNVKNLSLLPGYTGGRQASCGHE